MEYEDALRAYVPAIHVLGARRTWDRIGVMAGLVPAIHVLDAAAKKDVDARDVGAKQSFVASPGHDGERRDLPLCFPD